MRSLIICFTLLIACSYQSIFAQQLTITFPNACVKGNSIVIAAVGDVLLHEPLQRKASQFGFDSLWAEALPFIRSADIAYANLEGPIAYNVNESGQEISGKRALNHRIYTGFPMFNYPPSLAASLKDSGFDIVSTTNNHVLDRYSIGIDKTIQALNKVGLSYVGTRSRGSHQSWVHVVNKNGFKVGWISCTEMTSGFNDKYKQVLYCYKKRDKEWIINTIKELKSQVDAIIISPHWGEEYQSKPTSTQKQFAELVLDAGATAVIGSHPHVLQPLKKYITKDGRATIIMYSLGNFVSYQGKRGTRNTIILFLSLTQTADGTVIKDVRFAPMTMQNRSGVNNLRLTQVPNLSSSSAKEMAHLMPMGNTIFSPADIKNHHCH